METGRAYLVHAGDWHTYVGRFVRQVTPLLMEFTSVSKVHDTYQGDVWNNLAADDGQAKREQCEYRHYTTKEFLPIGCGVFEWVGQTPQEAGLPERPVT